MNFFPWVYTASSTQFATKRFFATSARHALDKYMSWCMEHEDIGKAIHPQATTVMATGLPFGITADLTLVLDTKTMEHRGKR